MKGDTNMRKAHGFGASFIAFNKKNTEFFPELFAPRNQPLWVTSTSGHQDFGAKFRVGHSGYDFSSGERVFFGTSTSTNGNRDAYSNGADMSGHISLTSGFRTWQWMHLLAPSMQIEN